MYPMFIKTIQLLALLSLLFFNSVLTLVVSALSFAWIWVPYFSSLVFVAFGEFGESLIGESIATLLFYLLYYPAFILIAMPLPVTLYKFGKIRKRTFLWVAVISGIVVGWFIASILK